MTIFRSFRRSARAGSRSEFDRRRAAPGPPSPIRAEQEPVHPKHPDARPPTEAEACGVDVSQGTSFDVAIVATKGRWLDRRSLVVEVELTLPSPLTLDYAVAMTESVEAAVLSAIPDVRPSSSGLAIPRSLPWLNVSGRTNTSATTTVAAASEQDLAGGS